MPSSKKLTATDHELDRFYHGLREYYKALPHDGDATLKQEDAYRRISRVTSLLPKLKCTKVLHPERISTEPMIYTANHIGSFDQFHIQSALGDVPLHYLVNDKVPQWPIRWNIIYKPTGAVVVERGSTKSWEQARTKLMQYILHGSKVFVFAEGTRRGEDNIGDMHPGITKIAQDSGSSIGTFAIKNTAKLHLQNPIVCAGETIKVGSRENLRDATERIKTSIVDAYDEIVSYEHTGRA